MNMRSPAQRLEPSLSREAYCDASFFKHEQEKIFCDQWFCVGRVTGLEARGDFPVVEVAGEIVIFVRGDDAALHAHLNLCRHRGSRLLCGEGTLRGAIRCPYHAWAYALDGGLMATPFIAEEAVPAASRALHGVAVESWGGFLFLHLQPDHARRDDETLPAALGAIPERLARYPLERLVAARTLRYDVAANWKVLLENYNECYHCAGVHPELCALVPSFKQRGGADLDWNRGIPHRDGAYTFTLSGTSTRALFPQLDDDERTRHKGELLYPNVMLSLSADHVAAFTLWPIDPNRTTILCDFLFDPDEIAKPSFDPSDAVDFWDTINRQDWQICESVQAGMSSRAFSHGYYAPMEDSSLDIRRYVARRLGDDAVRVAE